MSVILNIRLKGGNILPVKAHRILKDKYPSIELFVHYGVKEGGKRYQKGYYCVSDKNGLAVSTYNYSWLKEAIEDVIKKIDFHGEEKVAAKVKERAREFERMV